MVKNVAAAITQSMATWERKEKDHYPTPYEATFALLEVDAPANGSFIREPACGEGHISRCLLAAGRGYQVFSSDLRRTGYGTPYEDYLESEDKSDAVFTNPPFKYAAAFIRRALRQAPYVAMLLKSNYWHTQDRIRLFDEHPPQGIYPLTWRLAFLEDERGKSPLMDCTWFVWRPGPLRHQLLIRPKSFPQVQTEGVGVKLVKLERALIDNREALRALRG